MKKLLSLILLVTTLGFAQYPTPIFGGATQTVVAPKYFDFIGMEQTGAGPGSFTVLNVWITPTVNDYNALNALQTCMFWGNPATKNMYVYNRVTNTTTYSGLLPAPSGTPTTVTGTCNADLTKSYFEFGKCSIVAAVPVSTVGNCVWGGLSTFPNNSVRLRLYLLDTGGVTTGFIQAQTSNYYSFIRWW